MSILDVRVAALAALVLAACSDPVVGTGPTGSVCPDDSMLTYETFARDFMSAYCTRCHGSNVAGSARNGAPSDHNFDTLEALRATNPQHIDEQAAAGPRRTNTAMPPSSPSPSSDERHDLGEWLACGMP